MSIALERINTSRFESAAVFDSLAVNGRRVSGNGDGECSSSSSSSSIGRNSDEDVGGRSSSEGDEDCKDDEAQSAYKGPLDMMDSLEEVLPMRRGISKFYQGKSKSFTSLLDATSSPSIKDIAKPENAYSRRRRNLLAANHFWSKNNKSTIAKRPISCSKSSMALATAVVALSSPDLCTSEDSSSSSNSHSPPCLPPRYPRGRGSDGNCASSPPKGETSAAWRSYSVEVLPHCAAVLNTGCCD